MIQIDSLRSFTSELTSIVLMQYLNILIGIFSFELVQIRYMNSTNSLFFVCCCCSIDFYFCSLIIAIFYIHDSNIMYSIQKLYSKSHVWQRKGQMAMWLVDSFSEFDVLDHCSKAMMMNFQFGFFMFFFLNSIELVVFVWMLFALTPRAHRIVKK